MKSLFIPLLLISLLFANCRSQPSQPGNSARDRILRFAQAFGEALVQTKGTEIVKKHAPQLMLIFDVNHDDILQLSEILALDFEDPAILALVIIGIEEVVRERSR